MAHRNMRAHDNHLGVGEFAWLVEKSERHARFTDIVNESGLGNQSLTFQRQPELGREIGSEPGDQKAMLISDIVVLPDDIEPRSDLGLPYGGNDGVTATNQDCV